jgi:tetrahydromethanopterin S-methyltransferase subunit B
MSEVTDNRRCEKDSIKERVSKLENRADKFDLALSNLSIGQARSDEKMEHIFKTLDSIVNSIAKIEAAVDKLATKDDPFKSAIFNLGMFFLKAGIIGGLIIYLAVNFG